LSSAQVSASATAGAQGGKPIPLDVMFVLDTTASMNTLDANCSIAGATRVACALAGIRTILAQLAPSVDRVGLTVFPGLQNAADKGLDYDCSSTPRPTVRIYDAAAKYELVPLSSDYRTSDTAPALNPSSNLVRAVRGAAGCQQGLDAVGGVDTYYAAVITAAQSALISEGRPNVQKVMIFLSDGDANATSNFLGSTVSSVNECHQGIAAAAAAASAGTWVYSIAYGASGSAFSSCSTDSGSISACSAMQQIASDSKKFYADTGSGSNGCTSSAHSTSDLTQIFQTIGSTLTTTRLLPDNTT
jgi:hypothetical protein